jgi:hypothetical protein
MEKVSKIGFNFLIIREILNREYKGSKMYNNDDGNDNNKRVEHIIVVSDGILEIEVGEEGANVVDWGGLFKEIEERVDGKPENLE